MTRHQVSAPAPPVLPETTTPVPSGRAPARRREVVLVTLGSLAAAAYVATGSWHVSLWYDEAATLAAATRDLPDLAAMTRHVDAVHGVNYAFMHGWMEVFGTSPFAVRLPSALAVGATVAGVYVLARRLADVQTAALAAVFFAVLPRVTWAGIEARSTALTIAVAVWVTFLLVRALDRPDRAGRWLGYGLLLAAGLWLNIFLALLVPAHALTVLASRATRRTWTGWLLAAGVACLAAAPVAQASREQSAQLGGVRLPLTGMVRNVVVNQWFLGATPTEGADGGGSSSGLTMSDVLSTGWLAAALVLAAIGWGLALLALLPRRDDPAWRRVIAVAVPWLVVPSVVAIAYSVVLTPVYHQRYLAFCAPALALLLALGLRRLPSLTLREGVVLAVVAASLVVFVSQRQETAKSGYAWSRVADLIDDRANPGDAVYHGPRTPPEGEVVRKSTRLLAQAYPQSFEGLNDVTLAVDAIAGETLVGTSRPLDDVRDRLGQIDTLWVIRWADYPEDATAREDRLLRDAGLRPDERWVESTTVVTRFVRH